MDDVFIDICQSPANIDLNSKNVVTSIKLPDQQLINIIFVCLFIFFFFSDLFANDNIWPRLFHHIISLFEQPGKMGKFNKLQQTSYII